jgi:hypothetical protein
MALTVAGREGCIGARHAVRPTRGAAFWQRRPGIRNIVRHRALLSERDAATTYSFFATQEAPMATRDHDRIVETAREARGAEPGPSVLALLTVSTGLAVLILGGVWFVFFRT